MDMEADIDKNSDLLIGIDLTTGKTKNILASTVSMYWSIKCSAFFLKCLHNTVCSSNLICAFQNPIYAKFYLVYQLYLLYFTLLKNYLSKLIFVLFICNCLLHCYMSMLYLQLGSWSCMHSQWWVLRLFGTKFLFFLSMHDKMYVQLCKR